MFDLKTLFTYELANIPLAIATSDGILRKTQKSTLLHLIEQPVQETRNITKKFCECVIFDMMALIQSTTSVANHSASFGEYSEKLFVCILEKAISARRIDCNSM